MGIYQNVTLITCDYPQCGNYLLLPGIRMSDLIVMVKVKNEHGWEIKDESKLICPCHPKEKIIQHKDKGPGY